MKTKTLLVKKSVLLYRDWLRLPVLHDVIFHPFASFYVFRYWWAVKRWSHLTRWLKEREEK